MIRFLPFLLCWLVPSVWAQVVIQERAVPVAPSAEGETAGSGDRLRVTSGQCSDRPFGLPWYQEAPFPSFQWVQGGTPGESVVNVWKGRLTLGLTDLIHHVDNTGSATLHVRVESAGGQLRREETLAVTPALFVQEGDVPQRFAQHEENLRAYDNRAVPYFADPYGARCSNWKRWPEAAALDLGWVYGGDVVTVELDGRTPRRYEMRADGNGGWIFATFCDTCYRGQLDGRYSYNSYPGDPAFVDAAFKLLVTSSWLSLEVDAPGADRSSPLDETPGFRPGEEHTLAMEMEDPLFDAEPFDSLRVDLKMRSSFPSDLRLKRRSTGEIGIDLRVPYEAITSGDVAVVNVVGATTSDGIPRSHFVQAKVTKRYPNDSAGRPVWSEVAGGYGIMVAIPSALIVQASPSALAAGDTSVVTAELAGRDEPGFDPSAEVLLELSDPDAGYLAWTYGPAENATTESGVSISVPYAALDSTFDADGAWGEVAWINRPLAVPTARSKRGGLSAPRVGGESPVREATLTGRYDDSSTGEEVVGEYDLSYSVLFFDFDFYLRGEEDEFRSILEIPLTCFGSFDDVPFCDLYVEMRGYDRQQNELLGTDLSHYDPIDLRIDNGILAQYLCFDGECGDRRVQIDWRIVGEPVSEYAPYVHLNRWAGAPLLTGENRVLNVSIHLRPEDGPGWHIALSKGTIALEPNDYTMLSQAEAWPYIPDGRQAGETQGAKWAFEWDLRDHVVDTVEVVLPGGAEDAGATVTFSASWVERSGGHLHGGSNSLTPPDGKMGHFFEIGEDEHDSSRGISWTTSADDEGKARTAYRTPLFGGKVLVKAIAVSSGTPYEKVDTLMVRVPDLHLLPNSARYVKV